MQISFEDLLITFLQWKQQHQNAVKRFDITIIVFIIVLLLYYTVAKKVLCLPEVFLRNGVLKICFKFTEHPCHSAISIKLL